MNKTQETEMQLIVDINNQSVVDKIVKLLKIFEEDGVKVSYPEKERNSSREVLEELVKTKKDYGDDMEEAIANWQEELMTHENPDIDDDEILPEAYMEYKSEKHTA